MSQLIVIGYADQAKAEQAREDLYAMGADYLVELHDAVVATADGKGRIKLNQMVNLWSAGMSGGSLWGRLLGLLFLHPLFGVIAGAAAGALTGALSDYGINDAFMRRVAAILKPGRAALFLLSGDRFSDRVVSALAARGGEVIRTNLDTTEEGRLREAFEKAHASVQPADEAA